MKKTAVFAAIVFGVITAIILTTRPGVVQKPEKTSLPSVPSTEPMATSTSPAIQSHDAADPNQEAHGVVGAKPPAIACENGMALPDGEEVELSEAEIDAQAAEYKAKVTNLVRTLTTSSSAEHLQLAALLEQQPAKRLTLLQRALSTDPNNPMLIRDALDACVAINDSTLCDTGVLEDRLLSIDFQNSESWMRIAANRFDAGNTADALYAVRQAGSASESRTYWVETIELTERGLASTGGYVFQERAAVAFGVAAMKTPRYADYYRMCSKQSSDHEEWARACLAYGERLAAQSNTELGINIALGIQKLALTALGDLDQATALKQHIDTTRKRQIDRDMDEYILHEMLLMARPALFSEFLETVKSQGELQARRVLAERVRSLLDQDPDIACEAWPHPLSGFN